MIPDSLALQEPYLNNLLIISTRHTSPKNTRKCFKVTQLLFLLGSLRQNSEWVVKFVQTEIPVHNCSKFQKVYVCSRNCIQSAVAWLCLLNLDKRVYVMYMQKLQTYSSVGRQLTTMRFFCITLILCTFFFLFTLWELSMWVIHKNKLNCIRRRPTRVGM
jgi:hypothetical protein